MRPSASKVAVIGAGVGGLVSALSLADRGFDVTVLEKATAPGGKLRQSRAGDIGIDAGPTVFTLRKVFDEILASVGVSLSDVLTLRPLEVLARHAWSADARLDLFADLDRAADAIGHFAGRAEALRYRAFCAQAKRTYATLDASFMRTPQPSLTAILAHTGWRSLGGLHDIKPFTSMWRALGSYFHDPRLRQLFGRYATYCGSSPFHAPATLMLVAHVEQDGVWSVDGGMVRLAETLAALAAARGVDFRYGTNAQEIVLARGRAAAVVLENGERVDADAVVFNGDVAAIANGRLGEAVTGSVPRTRPSNRSLSAITWTLSTKTEGFPLLRHNVFFSRDYRAEFDDIFGRDRVPREPTVYVCAQDRSDEDENVTGDDRLLCLINAPANGDRHTYDPAEIAACETRVFQILRDRGLTIHKRDDATRITTPTQFNTLFPMTGGALYGQNSHGWTASFRRPGVRSRIPGLYLAGGSTHPGPGVPMAALSGRMAAAALMEDHASTKTWRGTAMSGGTSTHSATTAGTASR